MVKGKHGRCAKKSQHVWAEEGKWAGPKWTAMPQVWAWYPWEGGAERRAGKASLDATEHAGSAPACLLV